MQSLNEELQTVNIELQSKADELSVINSDIKNLLNSIDIATIFLDNSLCVRRFTSHATRIFKLILSDAGRPLSDIVTDLDPRIKGRCTGGAEYPGIFGKADNVAQRALVYGKNNALSHPE